MSYKSTLSIIVNVLGTGCVCQELISAYFGVTTGLFDSSFGIQMVSIGLMWSVPVSLTYYNLATNFSLTRNCYRLIDVLFLNFKLNQRALDIETGITSIPKADMIFLVS
jgi:hypothetical protein